MTSPPADRLTRPQTLLPIIMGAAVLLFVAALLLLVLTANGGSASFDAVAATATAVEASSP